MSGAGKDDDKLRPIEEEPKKNKLQRQGTLDLEALQKSLEVDVKDTSSKPPKAQIFRRQPKPDLLKPKAAPTVPIPKLKTLEDYIPKTDDANKKKPRDRNPSM